jgi:two-component system response regulator HydG
VVNERVLLATADRALVRAVSEAIGAIERVALDVVASPGEALARVRGGDAAVMIVHVEAAGDLERVRKLLTAAAAARPAIGTIAIVDGHRPEPILALLKMGVADCLSRPLDLGRLAYLVDQLSLPARVAGHVAGPASETATRPVGRLDDGAAFLFDPASKLGRVVEQIRRIAPLDSTVLLGGETGTGKTRLAGLIHRLSTRAREPFLVINCGAMTPSLVESEMFGHVRGAFTGADGERVGKFAEVGRGTLFLDEVDSLPLPLQAKLLRAVEERVFEPVGSNRSQPMQARLIAACNRALDQEVAAGRFRPDLYYRLNVVSFHLPPLREQVSLIPVLARELLAELSARAGRAFEGFADDALAALTRHTWPGNIRELRNTIERAVALSNGPHVEVEDLPDALQDAIAAAVEGSTEPEAPPAPEFASGSLAESREQLERSRIHAALRNHGNNRLRAAAELGISRVTLYKKLHKYDLLATT